MAVKIDHILVESPLGLHSKLGGWELLEELLNMSNVPGPGAGEDQDVVDC